MRMGASQPKKRLLSLVIGSVCLLPMMVGAETSTEGQVSFIENKDQTFPVNPNNPQEEIQVGRPPTHGPLSLNYVPDLRFQSAGEQLGESVYFNADLAVVKQVSDGKEAEVPNFIQLTDNRSNQSQWRLYVKQNQPLTSLDGKDQLVAAKIVIKNMVMTSLNDPSTEGKQAIPSVELTGEKAVDHLIVDADNKKGNQLLSFGGTNQEAKKSVQLVIPMETRVRATSYTTSLTWTLIDAP